MIQTVYFLIRKESRARGHIIVLMLGYMIIYYIKRYWREEETVGELSTISEDVVRVGGKKI